MSDMVLDDTDKRMIAEARWRPVLRRRVIDAVQCRDTKALAKCLTDLADLGPNDMAACIFAALPATQQETDHA